MDNRLKLQLYLEKLCPNVYFQPPSDMMMRYPAILYSRDTMEKQAADNIGYIRNHRYAIQVMDYDPDSELADRILELPYSTFDRQYVVNGLNHTAINLYF